MYICILKVETRILIKTDTLGEFGGRGYTLPALHCWPSNEDLVTLTPGSSANHRAAIYYAPICLAYSAEIHDYQ